VHITIARLGRLVMRTDAPRHAELLTSAVDGGRTVTFPEPPGALRDLRSLSLLLVEPILDSAQLVALRNSVGRLATLTSIGVWVPGRLVARDSFLHELLEGWKRTGLRVRAEFVLEAGADAGAALDGRAGPLTHVLEQSRTLTQAEIAVRWHILLVPGLVFRLESLYSLARDESVDAVVVDPSWLNANLVRHSGQLSDDERRFANDFITVRLLQQECHRFSHARIACYRALQSTLGSTRAESAAAPEHRVAVVRIDASGPAGSWSLSHESRPGRIEALDDSGPVRGWRSTVARLGLGVAHAVDAGVVMVEGARGAWQWLRAAATRFSPVAQGRPAERPLRTVLVIGAYGGDHIGDAAICGGVLRRLHERHGTSRAILMSQRPAHTRRLAGMLETPVKLTVEAYEHASVRSLLGEVDAVVFGGGPLMDLPRQLVRHLYTTSLATRRGVPFLMEGIGIGPFVRAPSAWIARRLVRMASSVSVRTASDQASPLLHDISSTCSQDPAFDYLDTRGSTLNRIPPGDREWIDTLLRGTEGRLTVGLNVRPIRHDFTRGTTPGKRVEYTRAIESRFEERLADCLRRLSRDSTAPPCVVFFPMNAIQFGMSDLRSAYRIKRLVRDDVDFRIWEGDPALDSVVELLRRLDMVVTMRFHAAIFALAQRRPVIGIDYRIGADYKVTALLRDAGRSDHCTRIDQMTSDWLYHQLTTSP
jgi:polysaccharide pyruvyl transferase WcaK-like protein